MMYSRQKRKRWGVKARRNCAVAHRSPLKREHMLWTIRLSSDAARQRRRLPQDPQARIHAPLRQDKAYTLPPLLPAIRRSGGWQLARVHVEPIWV